MRGVWTHFREASSLTLGRSPFLLAPLVLVAVLIYGAAHSWLANLDQGQGLADAFARVYSAILQEDLGRIAARTHATFIQEAFQGTLSVPLLHYLGSGLALVAAAFGASFCLFSLLRDLEERGAMVELLAAPLGGGLAGAVWLLTATLAGGAAGMVTLLLAAAVGGIDPGPETVPVVVAAAAIFAGLSLLVRILVPRRWHPGCRLVLLPLLALPGALIPAVGLVGPEPLLVNPLHHAARVLHMVLWEGPDNPFLADQAWSRTLVSVGLLVALPVGLWVVALGFCRQGVGLRRRA